jgi:hypothetical protein
MRYLRPIHQGNTPVPGTEAWGRLSEDERKAVYGAYQAIAETPGVRRRPRRADGGRNNRGSLSV